MITLTKVKFYKQLSEETGAFSADIQLDGRTVGDVQNTGKGGCNHYHWSDRAASVQICNWADNRDDLAQFERLDQIVDDLLIPIFEEQETKRRIKGWCKKSTVFRLHGDEDGVWRTVKSLFSAEVKDWLVKKYGDKIDVIANEVT